MRHSWKAMLLGIAPMLALASPSFAVARCGDLNNDNQVTVADVVLMSQCIALGNCPASVTPGPTVCGTGMIASCGDAFGDGNTTTQLTTDLAVLSNAVAGLTVLHDLCAPVGAVRTNSMVPTTTITASERWDLAHSPYTLEGLVQVQSPPGGPTAVLTIDAGVVIKGDVAAVDVPAIFILPGAKIEAVGDAANPIIMTSSASAPNRKANDWGGLNINGHSTVNRPDCLNEAEGIPEPYGGCDPNDSSGEISYVRVEFAGRLFTPDNELNNFTMNGVGAETRIDHVMAHTGADDCIEWFGGTVNTNHMVAANCGDDGFDWQLGWTGSLEYGLYMHNGVTNYSAGTSQSRGIEADNSEFGFEDQPRSNPGICNVTLVGDRTADGQDRGILFRRGTGAQVGNSIIANFKNEGVNLNDASTSNQACNAGPTLGTGLIVRDSVFFNNGAGGTTHAAGSPGGNCGTTAAWYGLLPNMGNANGSNANDPKVSTTYPAAGQLYDTRRPGASAFTPTAGGCPSIRDFFGDTTYAGAFDPAAACNPVTGPCDWLTKPWISFDVN
jgi:hypothetical protein